MAFLVLFLVSMYFTSLYYVKIGTTLKVKTTLPMYILEITSFYVIGKNFQIDSARHFMSLLDIASPKYLVLSVSK